MGALTCPAAKTRLLIVDDHAVARESLCALFSRHADVEVVGEARDGAAAIAMYRSLRPDVAIIDLRMPKLGGIEVISAIIGLDPEARLLALTPFEGDADNRTATAGGGAGIWLKGGGGEEIRVTVREVCAGNQLLSKTVRDLPQGTLKPDLSRRDIEVLTLLAEGMPNQAIANKLGLTLNTVNARVQSVLLKLDAIDRTEAAVMALKRAVFHRY